MKKLTKHKSTTSSHLLKKNKTYRKMYCKMKNIDTVVMDSERFFGAYVIYCGNKCLKNIVVDLNNPEKYVTIDLNTETTIKNISFLNHPMIEGITIPLEVLNERFGFQIFVAPDKSDIKKINILNGEDIDEINIDENVSWYEIKTQNQDESKKIEIIIGYNDKDKKNIIYDTSGNKNVSYEKQTIKENSELDLRKYNNTGVISCPDIKNHMIKDEFIITPHLLKNKHFNNFKNIIIDKLTILDDNEMLLNPKIIELNKVALSIVETYSEYNSALSNIMFIENIKDYNKTYIYINEKNELKVIEEGKIRANSSVDRCKFIMEDNTAGVIIKYKKNLKFDLILNNKLFHINKTFVNWYLNNKTRYDQKIIPFEYNLLSNGNENIYDISDSQCEYISNYIYETLLDELTDNGLFDNFNNEYNEYLSYLEHIKELHDMGYSYKALIYLHKNSFDNITGINKSRGYRNVEDKELINEFNYLGKKLVKRRF